MKKVYVVQGSTGEYSDHDEWPVAAYLSERRAAERVAKCEARARELGVVLSHKADLAGETLIGTNYSEKCSQNEHDPHMKCDYTGVRYSFYAVDLVDWEDES